MGLAVGHQKWRNALRVLRPTAAGGMWTPPTKHPDRLRGLELVFLLCGGDKSTQRKDIRKAKEMAARIDRALPRLVEGFKLE